MRVDLADPRAGSESASHWPGTVSPFSRTVSLDTPTGLRMPSRDLDRRGGLLVEPTVGPMKYIESEAFFLSDEEFTQLYALLRHDSLGRVSEPCILLRSLRSPKRQSIFWVDPVRSLALRDDALSALLAAVDSEPVENGVHHPAERDLAVFVDKYTARHIVDVLWTPSIKSSRSAALLRLLGRVPAVEASSRLRAVENGLASASIEVRDAAMQAAESWADLSLVQLLRNHQEPVAWLADYAARVARDIEA